MPPAVTETTLTVQVNGQAVEIPAAIVSPGHYCVTAEGLSTLLGFTVTQNDAAIDIATK